MNWTGDKDSREIRKSNLSLQTFNLHKHTANLTGVGLRVAHGET